jgi:hypothetical protein
MYRLANMMDGILLLFQLQLLETDHLEKPFGCGWHGYTPDADADGEVKCLYGCRIVLFGSIDDQALAYFKQTVNQTGLREQDLAFALAEFHTGNGTAQKGTWITQLTICQNCIRSSTMDS